MAAAWFDHRRCAFGSRSSNETWKFTIEPGNGAWIALPEIPSPDTFLLLTCHLAQQCTDPGSSTPVVPFSLHYPGTIIRVTISRVEGSTVPLLRETWPLFSIPAKFLLFFLSLFFISILLLYRFHPSFVPLTADNSFYDRTMLDEWNENSCVSVYINVLRNILPINRIKTSWFSFLSEKVF